MKSSLLTFVFTAVAVSTLVSSVSLAESHRERSRRDESLGRSHEGAARHDEALANRQVRRAETAPTVGGAERHLDAARRDEARAAQQRHDANRDFRNAGEQRHIANENRAWRRETRGPIVRVYERNYYHTTRYSDRAQFRSIYSIPVYNREYFRMNYIVRYQSPRYGYWVGLRYLPAPIFFGPSVVWFYQMPPVGVWQYSQVNVVANNIEAQARDAYVQVAATGNQGLMQQMQSVELASENLAEAVEAAPAYGFKAMTRTDLFYLADQVESAKLSMEAQNSFGQFTGAIERMSAIQYYVRSLVYNYNL